MRHITFLRVVLLVMLLVVGTGIYSWGNRERMRGDHYQGEATTAQAQLTAFALTPTVASSPTQVLQPSSTPVSATNTSIPVPPTAAPTTVPTIAAAQKVADPDADKRWHLDLWIAYEPGIYAGVYMAPEEQIPCVASQYPMDQTDVLTATDILTAAHKWGGSAYIVFEPPYEFKSAGDVDGDGYEDGEYLDQGYIDGTVTLKAPSGDKYTATIENNTATIPCLGEANYEVEIIATYHHYAGGNIPFTNTGEFTDHRWRWLYVIEGTQTEYIWTLALVENFR